MIRHFLLGLLWIVCGCTPYIFDPSTIGDTSLTRGMEWVPPDENTREEFENIPEAADPWLPESSDPYTVVDLLDISLYNNPSTEIAWANARAAAFAVGEAESLLYPVVTDNFSFNYTNQRGSNATVNSSAVGGVAASAASSVFPQHYNWMENQLIISYLLLDFGGRCASIQAARQALYAANWTQNRTIQQVLFTTLQAYYTYQGNVDNLKAAKEDLKTAQTTYDSADALYTAGVAIITDALQAKANLIKSELNLATAQGEVKISYGALLQALGLPYDQTIELVPLPNEIPEETIYQTIDSFIEVAKKLRPDFAAAYANVIQQDENLTVAYSSSLPTLNAGGAYTNEKYLSSGIPNGHNYTSSLTLSMPIFSGFYYTNKIRNAKEQVEAAKATLEQTELSIIQDVVTSYWNLITAIQSVKFSKQYLEFAQKSYDASLESYRYGTTTFVTLITAQSTLADARAQMVLAKTQWYISLANLSYMTGTLAMPSIEETAQEDYTPDDALKATDCE